MQKAVTAPMSLTAFAISAILLSALLVVNSPVGLAGSLPFSRCVPAFSFC